MTPFFVARKKVSFACEDYSGYTFTFHYGKNTNSQFDYITSTFVL